MSANLTENMFGKIRGRFDEEAARVAARSLPQSFVSAFAAMDDELQFQAVKMFNEIFKARAGLSGFVITRDEWKS